MFPFGWMTGCCMDADARKNCRKAQLDFLKMMRDGLETRLSATNAAIATIERQLQQDSPASEEVS